MVNKIYDKVERCQNLVKVAQCSSMINLNNNIVLVLGNMLPNDMFIFNVYVYVF